jgi:glycosyltransferase involved in cell wall biosynthesis
MASSAISAMISRLLPHWGRVTAGKGMSYTIGNWRILPSKPQDGRPRVTWVLAGNEWVGSSRLKGILIDRYVRENHCGFVSNISYMPLRLDIQLRWQRHEWLPVLDRVDVLVIQTWIGSTLNLLEDCRQRGVAVVFTLSDMEFHKVPQRLFELIDAIVVSSEPLKKEASKFHKNVFFIDDPIEVPTDCTRMPTNHGFDPELVWFGHPDHWSETEFIKGIMDYPEFASLKLRTVTRYPGATHQWNPDTCWRDISQSDLAVIPCKLDEWGISKSSNRLASLMALGYPVIASPIPSYKEFIEHGVNGFFAVTERDWIECIRLLRDPGFRNQVGTAARETPALKKIKVERVAEQWFDLFQRLCN